MLQAILLGAVQGLTEFLPISSSGHLILFPWLFNFKDPGLGFDVALHWGTLLAVLVYFRNDIFLIVRGFWHSLFKSTRDLQNNIYQKLSWLLIIATIPGALIGKLLEEKAETTFRNPLLVAFTLAFFGAVLFFVDKKGKKEKNLNHINTRDSVLIGLSQAAAIIPGVSRSGATMISALGLGFKREDAAKFSFLMSAPIIFGAGLAKIGEFGSGDLIHLFAGFVSAAVFGFLAIKYLLQYISKNDFKVFAWYRIALAILIVVIYYARQ